MAEKLKATTTIVNRRVSLSSSSSLRRVSHQEGRVGIMMPLLLASSSSTSVNCAICDDCARGNNFGVLSCMACAAFFRSSIVQSRKYACRKEGKCPIDRKSRVGCRACRFLKCVRQGMKRELVQSASNVEMPSSEDQQQPHQQQQREMAVQTPMICPSKGSAEEVRTVQALLDMAQRVRRVRESGTAVPDAYFDSFDSLEQLLVGHGTMLLNSAFQFSTTAPQPWDKPGYMAQVEANGLYAQRPMHRVLDLFLVAEMAQTMPAFRQLDMADKIHLFNYVSLPIVCFINACYSAQQHSDTVMAPNGQTLISGFLTQRYGWDSRLTRMSKRMYCDVLKPYNDGGLGLSSEEFALLLAIFFSNSTAPNLSRHAQQLLYEASVHFSQLLLQMLQSRLGTLAGANRFMETIQLITHAFQAMHFYRTFKVYLDVFHLRGSRQSVFPRALHQIYSNAN